MDKYSKPKLEVLEIKMSIIANDVSNNDNGLINGGDNESWNSGIVEEFNFGD